MVGFVGRLKGATARVNESSRDTCHVLSKKTMSEMTGALRGRFLFRTTTQTQKPSTSQTTSGCSAVGEEKFRWNQEQRLTIASRRGSNARIVPEECPFLSKGRAAFDTLPCS